MTQELSFLKYQKVYFWNWSGSRDIVQQLEPNSLLVTSIQSPRNTGLSRVDSLTWCSEGWRKGKLNCHNLDVYGQGVGPGLNVGGT